MSGREFLRIQSRRGKDAAPARRSYHAGVLDADHPTTQQCQRQLAALGSASPSAEQQIADITAQPEAAVAAVQADPTIDRDPLAEQLEARACWAEDGEAEGSPRHQRSTIIS